MSLDPTATNLPIFAAHDQVDVAALSADGLFYRCFVWLNRATWAIEACCYRLLPSGGEVVVFHNTIAQATSTEVTDTEGLPLDSPKIIPVGTTFVVHWLQATDMLDPATARAFMLYRSTMDMTSFSSTTWNSRGAVGLLETHLLYDVCPVLGSDTDFVVARYTNTAETTVQRFDGFDWIDTVWTAQPSQSLVGHTLAVYAHDADNDVLIAYERTATGTLNAIHIDADDGGLPFAATTVMDEFVTAAGGGASWVQVGFARVATNTVAVVAEARASSNASAVPAATLGLRWVHHLVYRTINSDTAAQSSNIHWTAHLHMCSRPFAYAAASTVSNPRPTVYVLASYRSIVDVTSTIDLDGDATTPKIPASGGAAWMQAYQFGLNLDYPLWDSVSDGAGLRPRVVDTLYTVGVPDGRASGWHPEVLDVHTGGPTKRMNHISYASAAPPFGPDVKTRTIGTVLWARFGTVSDAGVPALQPEHADASAAVLYLEDPQTIYRDSTDPTQPTANFDVSYPRAMCQSVEIGRGLVSGGGTPHIYDGQRSVELGFPYFVEIIDWVDAESSGSETHALTSGLHQWYAIYTWRDAAGQLHRSRPSNIVTMDVTAGDTRIALFRVRTMTISLKDATAHYPSAPDISIELYRASFAGAVTEATYGLFYRVFGKDVAETTAGATQNYRPRDTPVNDPEAVAGNILIYDGLSDADVSLQGLGPFQYDANFGGLVEPLPVTWPACSVIAKFQNRLFGADSLDPSVIWYSDEIIPEPGGEFYTVPELGANQYFRIGDLDGEITAMKAMDNRLIIFTRSSIYALTVQDAGGGLLSIQSQPLHEGLGCISPRSVVSYPLGLMFQSAKGYYGLDRSGEATYGVLARSRDQPQSTAGASFEDDIAEAGLVMAASHDPSRHRVSIACNGRPVVTQTWSFTLTISGSTAGVWSIVGLSQTVSVTIAGAAVAVGTIADTLAAAVQALVDAEPPSDTLRWEVATVTSPANVVQLVLVADVALTLTGVAPGTCTNDATVAESTQTQPRVIDYFYDVQQSSRGELVQTSSTSRLAEIVGGCYWQGDTGCRHVALAQGAVLVERDEDEDLAYGDDTSSATVGVPIRLTWSWLHPAGLAGGVALDEICIITERYTDAAVTATLEYDIGGIFDGRQIPVTDYSWPRTGETTTPSDLRVLPAVRKARTHRLTLEESTGVTTDRTMSVLGLTAVIGVLPKTRRVADVHRGET